MKLIDAYDDRRNDVIRWGSDELDVALDIALAEGAAAEGQRMPRAGDEEEAGADAAAVGSREMVAEERLYLVPERLFQTCPCTTCFPHHL